MRAGPSWSKRSFLGGAVALLAAVGWWSWPSAVVHPVAAVASEQKPTVLPRAVPVTRAEQIEAPVRASLSVAGVQRDYVLVRPTVLDAAHPVALVLIFHGDGGDAWGFHELFPFERASGSAAVVAYLDGREQTWTLEGTGVNPDVEFALALIHALTTSLPVDRSRVFATGYSSGGFFVNLLACQRGDLLRAIASNAGGAPYPQAEEWPNRYPKCAGQRPVAVMALHGGADDNVLLATGFFSAQYWAYVNRCADTGFDPTGYPECVSYRRCPSGADVVWCEIPELTHWVWDDAAEASWAFFAQQPLGGGVQLARPSASGVDASTGVSTGPR
jgi:polyhydroxybutyrate depolymerase